MDTRFLESFLIVVELGSMAAAARRLGVTPAAVAQRVQALETDIGATLLLRSGRTVRPTEAGIAILRRGHDLLRDARELSVLAAGDALVGEIRLGAISTALTGLLPPMLKRLASEAPALDFYVVPGTSVGLYRSVIDGDLDAAILVQPQFALPKTCEWRLLRAEPLIVIAPRAQRNRDPHELLRTEPFIRYDRNHWGGRLADSYLRQAAIRPRERLELDSLEAIAVMVSEGLGVSLIPDWAAPWPEGVELAKLPLSPKAPMRNVGLIWLRASPRLKLIRTLLSAALPAPQAPR